LNKEADRTLSSFTAQVRHFPAYTAFLTILSFYKHVLVKMRRDYDCCNIAVTLTCDLDHLYHL